jgi:hypothetical protein
MLVSMEPLGGRKPSDMLAEMEKFKPKDMQSFYAYHFLQRLPREIRVLLAQDDLSNMAALAEKADQLVALHQPQHHDAVAVAAMAPPEQQAAVNTAEEDAVAAVGGRRDKGKRSKKKNRRQRRRSPSSSAVRKSPLCWVHIKYGDKAYHCEEPCAWPGN